MNPGNRQPRPRTAQAGVTLLDALVALALLGVVAVGVLSLLHAAVDLVRQADRLDQARSAATTVRSRLATISWQRLPEQFGIDESDRIGDLDTADGSAPADWNELLTGLPGGRIRATLEGLGPDGVTLPIDQAVALRVVVTVLFDAGPRQRRFVMAEVRG